MRPAPFPLSLWKLWNKLLVLFQSCDLHWFSALISSDFQSFGGGWGGGDGGGAQSESGSLPGSKQRFSDL